MQNVRQYVWSLLGRFAPSFIYLGTTILLARVLTPDDFGKIGVLTIIFTIADALTDAGLGGSLIKEKNLTDKDSSTIFNFNMMMSVTLYVILFFSANYIEQFFGIDDLALLTRLLALTFVLNAFSMVPRSLLTRNLQFKTLFYISVAATIIASGLSIAGAFWGMGVYSLVLYRIVLSIVSAVLQIIYSKFKYVFCFSKESFMRLVPFGLYTSLSTIIDTIYENLLTSIFGKTMGSTTAGYFYQAKKTEETLTITLANTISSVSFPVLAKKKDDREEFIKESRNIMLTISCLTLPALLLLSVYSEEIIVIMYGSQWYDSAPYFRLLMFAGCFMLMENLNRNFVKALGRGRMLFEIAVIKRGIGIALLFLGSLLLKDYLVHIYIFCSLIAYTINQIAISRVVRTSISDDVFTVLKIIVPSFVLCACFYISDYFISNIYGGVILNSLLLVLFYLIYLPKIGVTIIVDFIRKLKGL